MDFMISWWERNMSYNIYNISNSEVNTIRSGFGTLESYGSICRAICLGENTYTRPKKGKIYPFIPIKGHVHKNERNFHYKRD